VTCFFIRLIYEARGWCILSNKKGEEVIMNKVRRKIKGLSSKREMGRGCIRMMLIMHIAICLVLAMTVSGTAKAQPGKEINKSVVNEKVGKLHMPFMANRGQCDERVSFYAHTFGGAVFVTKDGDLVYSIPKYEEEKAVKGVALKEEFMGGKVADVKGEGKAVTQVNYFNGNDPKKWRKHIPTYEFVSLGEVYKGVDLKLRAYGNNVEKLFYVKPGANPEQIKIRLSGANPPKSPFNKGGHRGLLVNEHGELEVETNAGIVRFTKPVAYQVGEGKKNFVEVAYVVNGNEYGFKVGDYDRRKELVIDPLLAATFLGGSYNDVAIAIALDVDNNVYVAGTTSSSDFPDISVESADSIFGPFAGFDFLFRFEDEAFVAKLDSDLSTILAATFLGGSNIDVAITIALDGDNSVCVAGYTHSADFPGIGPGSADSTFVNSEGFVIKLDSALGTILAATFLGGSDHDGAIDIAVDSAGNIYVAGETDSADFPGVGPGSADNSYTTATPTANPGEAFVAKLDSNLSTILAATFLGGSNSDVAIAIALDGDNSVCVAGQTHSADFPGISPVSADSVYDGPSSEAFVAKLDSDLSIILAATFLGGSNSDVAIAIVLDGDNNIYVAGLTDSADFPGIGAGSADSAFAGLEEAFVAKLDSGLSTILAATYLGGNSLDGAIDIAVDGAGNVYVAGLTDSADFPGIGPSSADSTFVSPGEVPVFLFSVPGEGEDVLPGEGFVVKLDSDLSKILAATFLGGSYYEFAFAIAIDGTGNVYVAGGTFSPDFPGIGAGSADSTFVNSEAFVAKLSQYLSNGRIQISIDIKPRSCPNKLYVNCNCMNNRILKVAILGTESFNVRDIDIDTIRLDGITPVKSKFRDVTTPSYLEPCDCEALHADTFEDLVLYFKKKDIVETLGDPQDDDEIPLTLTGKLTDGTTLIEGSDCVQIKTKKWGKKWLRKLKEHGHCPYHWKGKWKSKIKAFYNRHHK
jgi:hypothetical protein